MDNLSFEEAVSKSVDIIRNMNDERLAPAVVGAVLSYILHLHYEKKDHERIFEFIVDGTRDYLRLREAKEKQGAGNA